MADIRINSLPSTATSFNTDDYIAIDGASAGTRKMLAANPPFTDVTLGASGPSVKSTLSARAPRQGLVFDGTAGTTATVSAFGTADFSVAMVVQSSLASSYALLGGATNSLTLYLLSSGLLQSSCTNVANNTAATTAVTAGKFSFITYVRSSGVGTYYVNGVAAGTTTDTQNYSAAITTIGSQSGSYIFNGAIDGVAIYNRALSAAEVVALYEAGAPSGADYNNASNTALNNSTFLNIDFTTFTSASSTGFTATNTSGAFKYAKSAGVFSIATGQRFRVRYTLSGTFTNLRVELAEAGVAGKSAYAALSAGTNEVTLVATGATANGVLQIYSNGSADNFTLSNVTIDRPGLLLAPDAAQAGGGLVWYDTSGNAANITLPASGVSWNVPSSRYLGGNWTTSGNLTVSGTDYNYVGGNKFFRGFTNYNVLYTGATELSINNQTDGANLASFKNNGNFLLGTAIDGGQKLQVAGGIAATGLVDITGPDNSGANGVGNLKVYAANRTALLTFNYQNINASGALLLSTAGTTALTLDSSQNATFAGNVTIGSSTSVVQELRTATSNASRLISAFDTNRWYINSTYSGTGTAYKLEFLTANTTALSLDTSQNATFAGTIKPQLAATASAPTYVKGAIYFDTTLNKLRVGGATGWETITSV